MKYIGMDGGGTHTTAVLTDADGNILLRREGPGLNYLNDGLEVCAARFRSLVGQLIPEGNTEPVTVCAGLAALDGPAPEEVLCAFQAALPTGWKLMLSSDLSIALAAHTGDGPGLMVVCGTGSMLLARNAAGQEKAAGGWGWKMGDPGSGYMLAREGIRRALMTHETKGKLSPLMTTAMDFFHVRNPRDLVAPLYEAEFGADKLAAFGAEVIRLAEAGEAESLAILRTQMHELAELAAALLTEIPKARAQIGLYGGIFQHSPLARELFTASLQAFDPGAQPELLRRPPETGAVKMAMRTGYSERSGEDSCPASKI